MDRFHRSYVVDDLTGCWNWKNHLDRDGYGRMRIGNRFYTSNRIAYILHHAEDTTNRVVRHKCDNPSCVNPAHLEIGTVQDNRDDMVARGRSLKGSKHPISKLTEEQVMEIRACPKTYGYAVKLAEKFNTTREYIYNIRKNKDIWKHV